MTGVVVSPGFVVSPGVDGLNVDSPIIGYRNWVSGGNVAATTAAAGSPASNLGNPSTYLKWRAASPVGTQYLTVTLNTADDIDYVVIAGHNFGSGQMPVSVEEFTVVGVFLAVVHPMLRHQLASKLIVLWSTECI
jgi:hypothetical protein